jgi:general stress protein YciG
MLKSTATFGTLRLSILTTKTKRAGAGIARPGIFPMKTDISKAAAALGKKGGAAGTGKAKARSKKHYSEAGKKSGEVRRLKALQRKGATR